MPITLLPPDVAAQIAAGEVVERPASVVKELVENAIDAGARAIVVELQRGGLDLIRVVDNGCGIPPDEIETACKRHATSKLASSDDLRAIRTLGFRGEALPSIIAAAGRVEIASRTSATASGVLLRFEVGARRERLPYGGAQGTSVAVRDLFATQPARLKFLRSPATEARTAVAAIEPYALAYPERRFTVSVDGRTVLATTGTGDMRDTAARVLGAEIAAQLLDIAATEDTPVRVRGLIGPPSLSRANRSGIVVIVNGRAVQPRRLGVAVEQAFASLLPVGRHPLAILLIDLPPEDLDVNVHPAKAEVRFRNEQEVFRAVFDAVRGALGPHAPVPAFGLGQAPPAVLTRTDAEATLPARLPGEPPPMPLWQALMHPDERRTPPFEREERSPAASPRLPLLRVVGQTSATYIVAEGPTGMYLIDQHAAHERVLYEQVRRRRAESRIEQQGLLAPVAVELSAAQAATLAAAQAALEAYGFAIEPFGERTVLLRAVPAALGRKDAGEALRDLLDALAEEGTIDDDLVVKTLACHGSVRAGKVLSLEEMRALILQLEECEQPRTCPHGRPTMIHLSAAALEREFRRR